MYKFQQVEQTKLAWFAGMLQSEANFYLDNRVRSKSNDQDYVPPPPVPMIKIEMVEKDVMQAIGNLVEQNVLKQSRQTVAGNAVYRVNITSRRKVEALLRAISPYIVGEKRNKEVQKLLDACDAYNQWVEDGGRVAVARLAARASHAKRKQTQYESTNESSDVEIEGSDDLNDRSTGDESSSASVN